MKMPLIIRVTHTFDDQPLAVLDLPGDGAELRVHQLRDLAAAWLRLPTPSKAARPHTEESRCPTPAW